MASEGVTFRWEAFNRWCDEYADTHGGMKPKVVDVRKWHRENAEKVWPDSNERPSVLLAVSHNKGRRVRGHKTCEYYKRYRAGKAAEQQLAARLQPAALSGRRILAVTAAARKHNTDCVRTFVKRPSPDGTAVPGSEDPDGDTELQGLEHADKRRRVRPSADGLTVRRPLRPAAIIRRSSSDGLSEASSWASGAETSQDDCENDEDGASDIAASLRARAARRFGPHSSYTHTRAVVHGARTGVHITVVRRDADGRMIEVETLPAKGETHQEYSIRQAKCPFIANGNPVMLQGLAGGDGGLRQPRCHFPDASSNDYRNGSGSSMESQEGETCKDFDQVPLQPQRCVYELSDEGRKSILHDQEKAGGIGVGSTALDWDWARQVGDQRHPGVAPRACRSARSDKSLGKQQCAPQFCRYILTPVGSVPVFSLGCGAARNRAVVRTRRAPWESGVVENVGAAVDKAMDPLDLLAEAACDALDSPRASVFEDRENATANVGALPSGKGASISGGSKELVVRPAAANSSGDAGESKCGATSGSDVVTCTDIRPYPKHDGAEQICGRHGRGVEAGTAGLAGDLTERGDQDLRLPHGHRAEGPAQGADVSLKQEVSGGMQQYGLTSQAEVCGAVARLPATEAVAVLECGGAKLPSAAVLEAAAARCVSLLGFERACANEQQVNYQQSASPLSTDSAAAPPAQTVLQPSASPHSTPDKIAEGVEKGAQALLSREGGVDFNAGVCGLITQELHLPRPLLSGDGCGESSDASAEPASVTESICATSLCNGPSGQLPLYAAALEAELINRAAANVAAANFAAALFQGQQPRLSLNTPAEDRRLALGNPGVLPSSLPLAALPVPGALATPPPAPLPMLWASSMLPGALTITASPTAMPLFSDASVLGGALAGAGAAGGAAGQLLPMMRLLQMQLATRGMDPNSCHD